MPIIEVNIGNKLNIPILNTHTIAKIKKLSPNLFITIALIEALLACNLWYQWFIKK